MPIDSAAAHVVKGSNRLDPVWIQTIHRDIPFRVGQQRVGLAREIPHVCGLGRLIDPRANRLEFRNFFRKPAAAATYAVGAPESRDELADGKQPGNRRGDE